MTAPASPTSAVPRAPAEQRPSTALTLALVAASVAGVVYFGRATGWSLTELLRVLLGMLALWGPLAGALFLLLRDEVRDPLVRGTLSAVASYGLTTVVYFGLAVFGLDRVFYVLHAGLGAIVLVALARAARRGGAAGARERWDWLLTAVVAGSLVVNIPFQTIFVPGNPNELEIALYPDQLYHTGLAYELDRHVPPLQQVGHAGVPERAYHMLSQLTTALLGRYTGQDDLLRVHIVYHYVAIEVALCLLSYCLALVLTGSRAAGYLAAALVYLAAFPGPRFVPGPYPSFYFTLYPYVSSGLDPVRATSPQMYSGIVVAYGVLLGLALAVRRVRRDTAATAILVVSALLTGALGRFRFHIFLVMLPGFVALMAWAWHRRRAASFPLAAMLAVLSGALLLAETRSAAYLQGTASLSLGFSEVAGRDWVNSWPFATALHAWVRARIADPTVFAWIWQVVCLPVFVALNVVGVVPLAALLAYRRRAPRGRELAPLVALVTWLVVGSTLGAMVLKADYDPYSVGGQLLLHTGWYVYPFVAPALWLVWRALRRRLRWSTTRWGGVALTAGLACVAAQRLVPPPWVSGVTGTVNLRMHPDELAALVFLRQHTPRDAVILSIAYANLSFPLSAIARRAAYMEGGFNTIHAQALRVDPLDDRFRVLLTLWRTDQASLFCGLLRRTPATHLVESERTPLRVRDPECLRRMWVSPQGKATVWEIVR